MLHRWNCRRCEFTVWGPERNAITDRVKSHVVNHHRGCITRGDFQLTWECPYCDRTHVAHEEADGIRAFRDHVYTHVEPLLEEGTHVADDVDGTGDVLVLSPLDSQGADNARIHFVSPCDVAVFVTADPAARLRLLGDGLDALPAWTTVVTTADDPLAGLPDVDPSNAPIEVVQLDGALGLGGLGKTLSQVLSEQGSANGKMSFEFDILSELVDKFDLQSVFKFLHLVTTRFEEADALSHFYVDPATRSDSTINMLEGLFDLTLDADDEVFTTIR